MIMKIKAVLKDQYTANYTLNTICLEMLFKSLYVWGLTPWWLLFINTEKNNRSPAPHLRKWKHHTQASKIDGKTCEWRTLFLFCSMIQRADSRGCFIATELMQTWTSEGAPPSHRVREEEPAQRDMTNARSPRGPQSKQVMNLNPTNVWPLLHQ